MLECIASGDIVSARNVDSSFLTDIYFPEESKVKSDGLDSAEYNSQSKDLKERTWTSLQYAEGISLVSKFMKETSKKCSHCGKKNPKITCPTFGWLNKIVKDADIRANFIREPSLVVDQTDGDTPSTLGDVEIAGDDASRNDEELSVSTKTLKELRELPDESFRRLFSKAGQKHLLPSEAEHILERLWRNEGQLCKMICDIQNKNTSTSVSSNGYAMFFLKALSVPPSKFRPSAGIDRGVLEHPQNRLLSKVQESNIALRNLIASTPDHPDIIRRWMDLQRSVNVLFDSTKGLGKSEREVNGIRQLLEKKEGILRQKMMGKRVNFACRSVISPDPYLAVNEIGIPPYFALKLTYPEKVTPWNVNKLRQAIINGAEVHPGASHYKDRDGSYKLQVQRNVRNTIARKLPTSRGAITQSRKGPESDCEGKVVYRHLQDGDIVLVNRQPTLHKPSMMAHVVRVLKGEKTLRMHYANCSTYNADFDGDEMNVHFPQDEISRAEAINIVNANKQYIVPTSGEPIRGLIQDHIVSAVILTKKDTFFTREEYHQILCASVVSPATYSSNLVKYGQKMCQLISTDEIQPQPPAIWKPRPLWTGKQVITAILCHITRGRSPFNVQKDGRIPKEYFSKDSEECTMNISNNSFIHGMIDKAQFGKYGLVHSVQELYGADIAGTLLSIFSRLFTVFLQMHGFTCGVDDLLLVQGSDKEREIMLKKSEALSEDVHFRFTSSKTGYTDPLKLHKEVEKVLRSTGESATVRLDRMMSNALNVLTSEVNKVLFPSGLQKPFPRNCLSLMTTTGAKGGLVNLTQISSLLGQQELEGKRVPRIVSGKTLPCFPPWDISCRAGGFISDRFLTGLRPQEFYFHCMAGRDGLVDTAIKTSRSGYLQRCLVKNLESLKVCYDYTVRDADGSVIQFAYGEDGVDVLKTSFISELYFLAANQRVVEEGLSCHLKDADLSKSNSFIKDLPDILNNKATRFAHHLSKNQRSPFHQIRRKDLMKLMKLKYLSSLAEPGEPVGVIAAQSVGEPSTQMTLNTFHLAGRGEMNVTLGIPRLQEILMNAKENIRTPVMTCPLLKGMTKEDGENLAAKLRRICIADIIEYVEVSTLPFYIDGKDVSTMYKLKMKLHPPDLYPPHSDITLKDCRRVLRTTFVDAMEVAITKHLEMISRISGIGVSNKEDNSTEEGEEEDEPGSKSANLESNDGGDNEDDDDDNNEDEGADGEKRKKQIYDEVEYDDGLEKKSPAMGMGDEHEDEPASDFESEVDQAEAADDGQMGDVDSSPVDKKMLKSHSKRHSNPKPSQMANSVEDDEMPESAPGVEPSNVPEASKKERKPTGVKRNKKISRVVFVEAKGTRFEAHIILKKEPHILLAEIAQKTAKSVYVKESKDIERCSVVEPKRSTDSIALQTAGVNFSAFWNFQDYLDVNKVVTNDIHAMLNTYGVEAARSTIINEVKAVFEPYGIKVNIRHLSLIADFMSANGSYRPMNRIGMRDCNTSPFSKMTFETATKVIVDAAYHGEMDPLESPSATVCLGQPVKFGTGSFDLLQELQL